MSMAMKMTTSAIGVLLRKQRNTMADGPNFLSTVDLGATPAKPPASLLRAGSLTSTTVYGSPVWRFVPRSSREGLEVLYIPGGAYVSPMLVVHWWIIRRIAELTGATVTTVAYPLAPRHHADETISVIDAVWEGIKARPGTRWSFVAGDSAGGHASLTLAMRHRDSALAPDGIIAISPWTDLTLRSADTREMESMDPMLRVDGARAAGADWARPHDPIAPELSPLDADLTGIAPTLILQGRHDIQLPDARRLDARIRQAGSVSRLIVERDGFHVYPVAVWTAESRRAFAAIADHVGGLTP